MANPIIFWTEPLNSPATVDEPHILRNDLVTISRKAPTGLIDATVCFLSLFFRSFLVNADNEAASVGLIERNPLPYAGGT